MMARAGQQTKQALQFLSRPWRWANRNPLSFLLLLASLISFVWVIAETARANNMGFADKSLWDWLDLLIVPAVLGLAAYGLNNAQRKAEMGVADQQRKEKQQIADQRRRVDQQIASERQWQATLEGYYDRMTNLLLKHELQARTAEGDKERTIARARTLAVLRSLDEVRKGSVVRFLHEVGLIYSATTGPVNTNKAALSLEGADLSKVDLRGADLKGVDLSGAHLRKANLEGANLRQGKLCRANLEKAMMGGMETNLSEADLTAANLSEADLRGAQVMAAVLFRANLSGAKLGRTRLDGANLSHANLRRADLTKAILPEAQLGLADLTEAFLISADLSGADLSAAILLGTDLRGAILRETTLSKATYDKDTKWPNGFDLGNAGCIEVQSQ